ncbi:MAG TPA: response regulator [Burkholderiaceae bacterium]|nr:response regulator [Burkholderiaceae bacterium]
MKPTALIVDDSLTVRMDLAEALESVGFASTLCSTITEARIALSAGSFDLLVLDVLLPDGDGVDFLREIRGIAATAATRVMLLSSEAEVTDRIRGLTTGADEYVGKPYDHSYFVARALELVREKGPESNAGHAPTVLVIDDSPTFREELRDLLETSGCEVVAACTGEEGLRVAVDVRPTVIVVDGQLPGIDGPTVIRRVRADAVLRTTPCVLLTASEERSGELMALDAGADAYVRKDEGTEIILARVSAVMRSARGRSDVGLTSSLLGPKKILTVDDSPTHLHAVADQLRQEGYDVIPARSGEEAIDLLAVESVDCILLDLVMPGLSGQETCRRIKASAQWRDIPLIMHTALEEQAAMIEGINAGADDYIAKSSDQQVLCARVRAQLRRKQFEDEHRNIREQLLQKELEIASANAARELAETRSAFVEELERKNQELEAFSYSVSHDLRAPLRSIGAFSQLLLEEHAGELDLEGQDFLRQISKSARRMGEIIQDLLSLARVGRGELSRDRINLSSIARDVVEELRSKEPARRVALHIEGRLAAEADGRLVRVALENLLGNAWKFTAKVPDARIDVGALQEKGGTTFFIRDNGAGFDMSHAEKLFNPFVRLHTDSDFPGTGIGLATVKRVVDRHGGRIWAQSAVDQGSVFYFTLNRTSM